VSLVNIKTALSYGTNLLQHLGITNPIFEVRLLLAHVLGKTQEYIIIHGERELTREEQENFKGFLKRRSNHEPIAYILGHKEFYGRDFIVNNQVLIPRPDTEILVEAVLESAECKKDILELGVGSGCIAVTLKLEWSHLNVTATDISNAALKITEQNAQKHGIEQEIKLIESNWFATLVDQRFDIIVSNPPYIADNEKDLVAKETVFHEPHHALFANNNGLEAYEVIAANAKNFLYSQGEIFVEIGFSQAVQVERIFTEHGYKLMQLYKDLAGYIRVLRFVIPDNESHEVWV